MFIEPPHDKTNKMTMRPAKTQISLGIHSVWPESSLSAWRKLGSLAIHWAHSEDSDQTGWMPRLIWVFAGRTYHLVGFVMRRLIYLYLQYFLLYLMPPFVFVFLSHLVSRQDVEFDCISSWSLPFHLLHLIIIYQLIVHFVIIIDRDDNVFCATASSKLCVGTIQYSKLLQKMSQSVCSAKEWLCSRRGGSPPVLWFKNFALRFVLRLINWR